LECPEEDNGYAAGSVESVAAFLLPTPDLRMDKDPASETLYFLLLDYQTVA
jgi:hypothetical protein